MRLLLGVGTRRANVIQRIKGFRALPLSQPHSKCMHRCLQIQELLSIIFQYVRIPKTLAGHDSQGRVQIFETRP